MENPPEPVIPLIPNENPNQEWLNAIKGNGPMPGSDFEYATRLTEMANIGVLAQRFDTRIEFDSEKKQDRGNGVRVDQIVKSQENFRLVHNPAHPDADPDTGYVKMPNVDHVTEIADMLVAKRSYEASVTALSVTKDMVLKALEIGK